MTNSSSEQQRILIVDDDRKILDFLVELLQQEDYEVIAATDGRSGLELALTCDPDVVISDIVMPGIGGLELCRQLKQDVQTARIPVLLISGSRQSAEDSIAGLTAGADDYLDIPFRSETFLVKVARLAERHRAEKHYRVRDITEQKLASEALKESEERYRQLVDLTERKRSEEALRESQAFFDSFMNNSPAVAFMKDEEGRYVYVNKPFEDLFGRKLSFLRGKTSFDWLPEETAQKTHEHDLQVLVTQEFQEIVETVPTQDGSPHYWLVFKFPITDAAGKRFVGGVGVDITERRLAEEALSQQVEREAMTHRISMAIGASLSLPEVLSTATRELGRALSASRVHLHLYNPENPISPVEHEFVAPECISVSHVDFSYHGPIGKHLLESAKPIVIDDSLNYVEGPAEFNAYIRAHARKVDLRSQIDFPLIVKGLFRGVLCIHQTDRLRHWTEDEVALVEAVAARMAIGLAQAELFEMVARAKQEWETTFDTMSDGIFIFDKAGRLKRVNRAGAAMERVHPRELLGRKCCDILRTSLEDEACVVEKAIEENRSVTIEITPEGLKRPLLVSVEPVLDGTDKTMAVVCTARDLSELRQVQAIAREHQSLLTNILESARESIYAVDTEGRFKWGNSATLLGFGCKREDFIGRQLLDMVFEGDRQLVNEKLKAALTGQAQTFEMRYFSPDARLRYARVDNSPLVVGGSVTGVLGIARDITEQKEERERAARADKLRALGQLASGVAHDFNNSLAAILGRAQLLRRQIIDDALLRNLDIIQTAAEDAAATVRRIQTFARIAPAKEFEMVDIRSLLHDAIEITRTRWENEARLRGLDYQVKLEVEPGQNAYGSASELREVFVNLIVNAVDAMPGGGTLSISCTRESDCLRLRFADTGTGMPEDVRQKIFEPFFTTKGVHGTGLGLSVSYSIIEGHEGSISITSELGVGTVFIIDLPACEIESSQTDEPPAALEVVSLTILVIDDEPSVRETLADMLGAMSHRVDLAESGQDALAKLASKDFDLVFTDLAMPDMDGWETAREIRKLWPAINIVLVTGYGPGTAPPAGEGDLVNGIIGKPFNFAQVGQAITEVMGPRLALEPIVV